MVLELGYLDAVLVDMVEVRPEFALRHTPVVVRIAGRGHQIVSWEHPDEHYTLALQAE